MNALKKFLPGAAAGMLICLCVSCASIQQDVYVSNLDPQDRLPVTEMEREIILQDGRLLAAAGTQEDASAVIARIDALLANPSLSENARGRLYALKGRAFLAEGKTQDAAKQLKAARQINPGDPQVLILEYRLDPSIPIESRMELSDDTAPLAIESAVARYREGKYAEAAAAFDAAFIALDQVYAEAYGPLRDTAWALKDIRSDKNVKPDASYATRTELSAGELVQVIHDHSDLFLNETGGKKMNTKELFSRLSSLNLFTPVSAGTAAVRPVSQEQIVTRIVCARFLWNLYTVRSGKLAGAAAYSRAYRNNAESESPVPDVPLDSPDFDAVLGCVENEIMELPDGIRFFPDRTFSAAEVLGWIKNLK